MSVAPDIDTILLACTHYPLLLDKIRKHLPAHVKVVSQGPIVASSLADYLDRHPEIETRLTKESTMRFYTTDDTGDFDTHGTIFFGRPVESEHLHL